MKLFIIGNGFDIGHVLPTGYWDFRTFLDLVHTEFLRSFEEHYDIYPGMSDEAKKKTLWSRFESNLANIDEDTIIDIGTSIELNLESGDVGIEDTLYSYFTDEYRYIEKLAVYLKQWVRSIRIRDCLPRTSLIDKSNRDLFLTFNYTAVLENVYEIAPSSVIHIHGSLRDYTLDPVLGHGNRERLQKIRDRITEAEKVFDEKECSICRVVNDYYDRTFKDTNKYSIYLSRIAEEDISDITVIGHSLDGIDMPYFTLIDSYTSKKLIWTVYCHTMEEAPIKSSAILHIFSSVSADFFSVRPYFLFFKFFLFRLACFFCFIYNFHINGLRYALSKPVHFTMIIIAFCTYLIKNTSFIYEEDSKWLKK